MSPLGSFHVSPRPRPHELRADLGRQQRPHMDQCPDGEFRQPLLACGIYDLRHPPPDQQPPNELPPDHQYQQLHDPNEHHWRRHPSPAVCAGCPRPGLRVVPDCACGPHCAGRLPPPVAREQFNHYGVDPEDRSNELCEHDWRGAVLELVADGERVWDDGKRIYYICLYWRRASPRRSCRVCSIPINCYWSI